MCGASYHAHARMTAELSRNPCAVHNKLKEKRAEIPQDVAYFSGADIPDVWVDCTFLLALESAGDETLTPPPPQTRRPLGAGRVSRIYRS